MASPRTKEQGEIAQFIEEESKAFTRTSAKNRMPESDNDFIFDEPMVQFADGDDPIFLEYKSIIASSHLTPREALAKTYNKSSKDLPARLSVMSWILPITKKTRESNRQQTKAPSRLWSYTRWYGEKFNEALREHVVKLLTEKGYLTVAPFLQPYLKSRPMRRDVTQTGQSATLLMPLDWAPSAFPMASSPNSALPTAAEVWSPT